MRCSPHRLRLGALTLLLVPLGIATKFYVGPGQVWVGGYAGGFLYVVFWVLLVLTLRPTLSERSVAGSVFAVTCALEVLQLWHPPFLEAARRPFLGQALLGSSFTWSDFPYYLAGAWAAAAMARLSSSRDRKACGRGDGTRAPSAAGRGSTGCRARP